MRPYVLLGCTTPVVLWYGDVEPWAIHRCQRYSPEPLLWVRPAASASFAPVVDLAKYDSLGLVIQKLAFLRPPRPATALCISPALSGQGVCKWLSGQGLVERWNDSKVLQRLLKRYDLVNKYLSIQFIYSRRTWNEINHIRMISSYLFNWSTQQEQIKNHYNSNQSAFILLNHNFQY